MSSINPFEIAHEAWATRQKHRVPVWYDDRTGLAYAAFFPDLGIGGEHHRVRRLDGGPFVSIGKADLAVMRAHHRLFIGAILDLKIEVYVPAVLPVTKERHAIPGKVRALDMDDHELRDWDEYGRVIEQVILLPFAGKDRLLEARAAYVATLGHAVESRGEPDARHIERARRTIQ